MASKKPAKVSTHEKKVNTVIGTAILYFGIGGRVFDCPDCGRTFSRGIFYERDKKQACSRQCLKNCLSEE